MAEKPTGRPDPRPAKPRSATGKVKPTARKPSTTSEGSPAGCARIDEHTGKWFAFFTDPDGLPLDL